MKHTNANKEYFTFTTKINATQYTMRPDHNNRTAIFNANNQPIATGGLHCIIWLLLNRPEIVSLWNGNQLEGTLTFA